MAYALVTGASKGIGKAIATCLAKRKFDLLIVARSEDLLQENAAFWEQKYGIDVQYFSIDLTQPAAAEKVVEWINVHHWQVQVLVNNAGYGLWGYFHELTEEAQDKMLQINMQTLFSLTRRMLSLLKNNTPAYILNVGSMAGLQAMPSLSAYSASKAFVNTFSRALHEELKPLDIYVTLLAPGSVDTHFVEVSGMHHMEKIAKKTSMQAEEVAEIAVKALFKKKKQVIPGFSNRLAAYGIKHLSKNRIEKIMASLYRKKD